MTPKQRADKICAGVEDYFHKKNFYNIGFEIQFGRILEEQIKEAGREAYADAMNDWKLKANETLKKTMFENGFNAAKDKAKALLLDHGCSDCVDSIGQLEPKQ